MSEHTIIHSNYFLTNTALNFPSKPDMYLSAFEQRTKINGVFNKGE